MKQDKQGSCPHGESGNWLGVKVSHKQTNNVVQIISVTWTLIGEGYFPSSGKEMLF